MESLARPAAKRSKARSTERNFLKDNVKAFEMIVAPFPIKSMRRSRRRNYNFAIDHNFV